MKKEDNIGKRIEEIVRKRGLKVTTFAESIYCKRGNVYKIFKANDISVVQLHNISKALNYNFFEDLAGDPSLALACNNENNAEIQFLMVIDAVLKDLKVYGGISFGFGREIVDDVPLPDYTLVPYFITFTKGETFEERAKGKLDDIMRFQEHKKEGMLITECINMPYGTQSLDIKIEYKTKEEWKKIILYAIQLAEEVYLEPTKSLIRELILKK